MRGSIERNLYQNIKIVLDTARTKAYTAVNFAMVEAYWHIGKLINESIGNDERAEYGTGVIQNLSKRLTKDFGKGFDKTNLGRMRQFYLQFPIVDALRQQLSWTHYRLILKVENEAARQFYLDECVKSNWSTRQLERQIDCFFYERILSSKNKKIISKEALTKEPDISSMDIIKDPYVLEFLGLSHNQDFFENDLENALITHIQKFLLELGRGFTFEARQKRISFDDEHFYIDLVFYNYILRCFVLIDLKAGKLTHQDLGQMQMYVNYYTRELRNEGDNPPIGILLCADKSESVVKYTLSEENTQIFASKYKLFLPTEEEFRQTIEFEKKLIMQEKSLTENSKKRGKTK